MQPLKTTTYIEKHYCPPSEAQRAANMAATRETEANMARIRAEYGDANGYLFIKPRGEVRS